VAREYALAREARMTTAETVCNRVKDLPEPLAKEVLNFIEFLAPRAQRRDGDSLMQAQASSLAAIWDNADDDVYNDA